MDEAVEIPIIYKGEELLFKAHVVRFGYVHHMVVDINGANITIERDEEGCYRALEEFDESGSHGKVDVELVKEIVQVLESL
jgi:hypothetical protein